MAISPNSIGSLAADSQSLDKLRYQARQSPDQALKAVAQQFETVFLNMMLKTMREATPQDGMMDSEQTKMFTGMLDQQLAQEMSKRGVGLAEVMMRQLSGGLPAAPVLLRRESCHQPINLTRSRTSWNGCGPMPSKPAAALACQPISSWDRRHWKAAGASVRSNMRMAATAIIFLASRLVAAGMAKWRR